MTVKRRPKGKGKSHRGDDALTFEEWRRRKSEETPGTAPGKPKTTNHKAKTKKPK